MVINDRNPFPSVLVCLDRIFQDNITAFLHGFIINCYRLTVGMTLNFSVMLWLNVQKVDMFCRNLHEADPTGVNPAMPPFMVLGGLGPLSGTDSVKKSME